MRELLDVTLLINGRDYSLRLEARAAPFSMPSATNAA